MSGHVLTKKKKKNLCLWEGKVFGVREVIPQFIYFLIKNDR